MVHQVTKFWTHIFHQHLQTANHEQSDMNMPVKNIFIIPILPTETRCKYFHY